VERRVADRRGQLEHGIEEVFLLCSFLPLLGILTALLPSLKTR
jgi:hypothetical protein